MDKLKPYQKVASRFQISEESAKYFLGRIQKSFKKVRPPHQLILDFIESQGYNKIPDAYNIATLMFESGIWTHALNSPPPLLVNGEEEV